ncbi:FAD/FMN-containing dehydrogenase [Sphingopyxis panaciterrae]|nr:FAD/FMN-containing dehydrogenase [Sphingopyxis panaciterrae]
MEEVLARFGKAAAIVDPDMIAPWIRDWRGRYWGAAPAILAPENTAEVEAIVIRAGELGVPLVPQGGNTSMVGGATPPADGSALILSLRRMKRIRELSLEDNKVVAEAGVILDDLHAAADAAGRRFPLSLGARGSATVGGLVSTNAGGTQVLRFGTMRRLVAGIEAVLPNGQVYHGLSALKKDNRGYDFNQLLIGGEGTLGVVTAATLELVPAVTDRCVAWVGMSSPEEALRLLRVFEAETTQVESFEIVPEDSLSLVLKHIPGTRNPLSRLHPWNVLIEACATSPIAESPRTVMERVLAAGFDDGLFDDAAIATSEAQANDFWRIRESLSEAEKARGPATQHDISVAINLMPKFMVEAAAELAARFPGTEASAFGHLGDGNVHFHVRAPVGADPAKWYAEQAPLVTAYVHDLVVASGGSISAEHGIGQMKREELERLGPPARLSMLSAIKRAMDPAQLFNPGKLVPDWTYNDQANS